MKLKFLPSQFVYRYAKELTPKTIVLKRSHSVEARGRWIAAKEGRCAINAFAEQNLIRRAYRRNLWKNDLAEIPR